MGNCAKNWYRVIQIFEVRQAHPRTILAKYPLREIVGGQSVCSVYFEKLRFSTCARNTDDVSFCVGIRLCIALFFLIIGHVIEYDF